MTESGMTRAVRRRPTAAAVLLSLATALVIVWPFFRAGYATGHDFEFHLHAWADAAQSWRQGVLYPRWADLANYRYGEPRFLFYPPLSWMLGALLTLSLPGDIVPGAFYVVVLTLAGVAMFQLAREYLPVTDAAMAAVLYIANPYHLVIVYMRSAFAELLVSALLPLLLLYALRLPRARWRAAGPMALVFGAIWLTNAPAALVTSYALALLLAGMAWQERSAEPLWLGGVAIAVGLLLAAVYLVPAAMEQPWIQVRQALADNRTIDDNFLYSRAGAGELRRAFNFLVSSVAVIQMGAFALSAWKARSERSRFGRTWWPLFGLGVISSVMMTRISAPLWHVLPKAEFIQFPWRWLFVLSLVVALVGTAGYMPRRIKHVEWVLTLVGLLVLGGFLLDKGWPGSLHGAGTTLAAARAGYFDATVPEYTPVTGNRAPLQAAQPVASFLGQDGSPVDAAARVVEWDSEEKRLVIESPQAQAVVLHVLSYPAWEARVNGRVVPITPRPGSGAITISLEAGKNEVELRFGRTPDRTAGGLLSIVGLALLAGLFFAARAGRQPTSMGARTSM
jgi:hypothetical protein